MKRDLGPSVLLGFGLVVLVLLLSAAFSYRNTRDLHENDREVSRTHEVLTELEGVLSSVKDAETGQRGYIITGEDEYLQPYRNARDRVRERLERLKELTQEDGQQRRRIDDLEKPITAKFDELDRTVALRKHEDFDAARKEVLTNRGYEEMQAIRTLTGEIDRAEEQKLQTRAENSARSYQIAQGAVFVSVAAGLLAICVAFYLIRRELLARHEAEQVARDESERFSTTLTSIGDGVIVTDAKGRVKLINPVAKWLTGWGDDAKGKPLEEVFHIVNELTRWPADNPVTRVLSEGMVVGLANHTLLIARDGSEHPVSDSAAPIRNRRGVTVGVILVFRDESERHHSEQALREHNRLTALRADTAAFFARGGALPDVLLGCSEALVEHLGVAFARIWTLEEGADVLVLRASAGMYTHLDGPHGRVKIGELKIGRIAQERRPHLTNAVPDDPWVSDPEWARQEGMVAFAGYPLLAEGRLVGVMAMFARTPFSDRVLKDLDPVVDSLARYIERQRAAEALLRAHAELEERVQERTADLASAIGALRQEIIVRKETEERAQAFAVELQRSNQELERFASVASHDLQEPLRKIQAFGDRLQSKIGDSPDETAREYLSRMRAAAARMRTLINDLLAFSRVGTQAQHLAPVDLGHEARQVVSDLENRIQQTDGRVELGSLATINADSLHMRQLLQNLIANGLKFHRPGVPPVVRVEGRFLDGDAPAGDSRTEPSYEITVSDNGIGFEEVYLDRIFELFQRLHGRNEYEGTGIGLAICRKIVERHGGTITGRSTPGQGATFIVNLPHRELTEEGTP
jgi:PAS domain S-box-containing protein